MTIFQTNSPEETEKLAEKIGKNLKGGEVIELISDVGGGKTTFVHGLARGAGSKDKVASPTFTISREYIGRLNLYHFDFYRLKDAGIMRHELTEPINQTGSVVIVEWADIVKDALPSEHVKIEIVSKTDTRREFKITLPEPVSYLLANVNTEH